MTIEENAIKTIHGKTYDQVAAAYKLPKVGVVGDGWAEIVESLCKELLRYGWKPRHLHQIKEKYGGLRFYTSYPAKSFKKAEGAISQAEEASTRTCESCGAMARLRMQGWVVALCDKCALEDKRAKKTIHGLTILQVCQKYDLNPNQMHLEDGWAEILNRAFNDISVLGYFPLQELSVRERVDSILEFNRVFNYGSRGEGGLLLVNNATENRLLQAQVEARVTCQYCGAEGQLYKITSGQVPRQLVACDEDVKLRSNSYAAWEKVDEWTNIESEVEQIINAGL